MNNATNGSKDFSKTVRTTLASKGMKTKADYEAQGFADMAARVAAGGDWSMTSACPYIRDGWQREAWLDGAWRWRNQQRTTKR